MAERLRRVARALQAFEQTNFQRLLFWLAADRSEKALDFLSMRQIADLVTETQNKLAIFAELFRIRIFVNAVDRRNRAMPELTPNRFIRREHEFFDQLMRFVVLDPFEPDRLVVGIVINFHFREIEIE